MQNTKYFYITLTINYLEYMRFYHFICSLWNDMKRLQGLNKGHLGEEFCKYRSIKGNFMDYKTSSSNRYHHVQ